MSRLRSVVQSYRQHAGTGQAVVTIASPSGSRKDVYLGTYGSEASVIAYGSSLVEWKAAQKPLGAPGCLSINELLLAFLRHAETYYSVESRELVKFKYSMKPVRALFGSLPADQFGPKALKAVRERTKRTRFSESVVWTCKRMNAKTASHQHRSTLFTPAADLSPHPFPPAIHSGSFGTLLCRNHRVASLR